VQHVNPGEAATVWSGKTIGGWWLFPLCARLLPLVGAAGAWILAWPIAAGFLLVGGRRQFGMASYWCRRRPGAGCATRIMLLWRHFHSYGLILCDRLLIHHRPSDFTFDHGDHELRDRVIGGPSGCILLAAHVGNWEVSGLRLSQILSKRLHVVMVRNDIPSVQSFSDQRMRGEQMSVIDPRDALGASLAIHAALAKGEAVCMLGDRVVPGQPWVEVDFCGGRARFPVGPFHVAAVTGAPIVVCFLMKAGLRRYRIEVDQPWLVPLKPRGQARQAELQLAAQRWATRLERQVRRYPLQWHNFYEFWLPGTSGKPSRRRAPPSPASSALAKAQNSSAIPLLPPP